MGSALFVCPGSNIAGSKVRHDVIEYILAEPASKRLTMDALIRWYFLRKRDTRRPRRATSDETRKKLSDAAKRQWQRVLGSSRSEETRKKISDGSKRRWAKVREGKK